MALNIKDIVVMILFPNGFASRGISPFGNIGSFDLLPETTDLDARMTSSPYDISTVDPNAPAPLVDPPTLELDISVPRCSTRVKTLPSHLLLLLLYMNLTLPVKLILTLFGRMLCPKNLMPLPKPTPGT
jgi:hypothetical protein